MNICFISTFFEGATIPFAKHLHDLGNKVSMFFLAREGETEAENLSFGKEVGGYGITALSEENSMYKYIDKAVSINVAPYRLCGKRSLKGLIGYLKNEVVLRKITEKLLSEKYDVIYINVNEEWDSRLCSILKRKRFRNVVIAYHEILRNHVSDRRLKNVVVKTMNLGFPIITYSENTARTLRKECPNIDVKTIYFGPFETYSLFDVSVPIINEQYSLFIGIIQPYKGLGFLYDAIIKNPELIKNKIVIAGAGDDSVLEKIKHDNRFILINRFLKDEEFANLVKYASCVICPYVNGSQSGITHTAMMFGTPVIATKVGAFEEFIEQGENGMLVDYGDTRVLAECISYYENEHNANFFVPEKLKWKNIAKKAIAFFDQFSKTNRPHAL